MEEKGFVESPPHCKNCKYFEADKHECRRYPPQVWGVSEHEGHSFATEKYPLVSQYEWCGEFKPVRPHISEEEDAFVTANLT